MSPRVPFDSSTEDETPRDPLDSSTEDETPLYMSPVSPATTTFFIHGTSSENAQPSVCLYQAECDDIASRMYQQFKEACHDDGLWWLVPGGAARVTVDYVHHTEDDVAPDKIAIIVFRASYKKGLGVDTVPRTDVMRQLIEKAVVKPTLETIMMRYPNWASTLFGYHTAMYIDSGSAAAISL
jgi:hypothetical protein